MDLRAPWLRRRDMRRIRETEAPTRRDARYTSRVAPSCIPFRASMRTLPRGGRPWPSHLSPLAIGSATADRSSQAIDGTFKTAKMPATRPMTGRAKSESFSTRTRRGSARTPAASRKASRCASHGARRPNSSLLLHACGGSWTGLACRPLAIVFAALAVSHWVERQTGWFIRRFVKTARATAPSRSRPGPRHHPRRPSPERPPRTSPRSTTSAWCALV